MDINQLSLLLSAVLIALAKQLLFFILTNVNVNHRSLITSTYCILKFAHFHVEKNEVLFLFEFILLFNNITHQQDGNIVMSATVLVTFMPSIA